jgi:hypothetical protein
VIVKLFNVLNVENFFIWKISGGYFEYIKEIFKTMTDPQSPQDGKPELTEALNKKGIKNNSRTNKRTGKSLLENMEPKVRVSGSQHPNSGSSYKGIF